MPSTGFTVVKTGLPNNYRPSTSFGFVKTGLSNLYRASTGFLKIFFPNYSPSKVYDDPPQALNRLCGSQNRLLSCRQSKCAWGISTGLQQVLRQSNWIAEQLLAFNQLWVCPSTANAVVKTGLLNLYRLSTGISVVETGMTILYRVSTILLVVKMCLRRSTGLQQVQWQSKLDYLHLALGLSKLVCPTSTSLQRAS